VRGRESVTTLIEEMLHRGRTGTGGVILVEGEPGMGKSLLLAEAAKSATTQGYTTVAAAADEFERMIPLCPLLLALGDAAVPSAEDFGSDQGTDPRMRAVARVRRSLEHLAAHGPVLVTADDLEHADPVTLLALRVLPRELAARPVSWILARSTRPDSGAAQLFGLLHGEGADRVLLTPLSDAAITEVTEDLLGFMPGDSLLSLAHDTGGNPLLLTELLRGLREENMLRAWAAGPAAGPERLPGRVRGHVQHQIGNLCPQTRQLIEVSAVLGRSFAVEDVAEMLGQRPAVALTAISDALAAGILVPAGEALAFRDGITWRAVAQSLPGSVSCALHHQAGRMFLERGDAARAAGHLIRAARQGDRRVLGELDRALPKILPDDARTAADLASRALELTPADDPARADRALAAVGALLAARRLPEAAGLVETSLAIPLRAASRAQLRCARLSVLTLSGRPDQARAEAEDLLAEPDLPAKVRDDATITLLDALADLPDLSAAEQRARGIARQATQARGTDRPPAMVVAAARALQATVRWNRGHIAEGLDLFREAVSIAVPIAAPEAAQEASAGQARGHRPYGLWLTLAAHLIDVGLTGEALALIDAPPFDNQDTAGIAIAQAGPALLRARIHLAAGRVEAARAEAEAAVGPDPESAADGFPQAMLARCMLGTIALRAGDLNSAGQVLDWTAPRLAGAGTGRVGVLCRILAAQVADARDGPAAAMRLAAGVYDLIGEVRWPLIRDPGTAPWLARLALAVGDDRRAAKLGAVAAELGRLNPDFPIVTASCAHAQGLLKNDIGALTVAAQTQPGAWASAGAAADLAAVLADCGRVTEAIEWLDRAHGSFVAAGATRDAARVRGMLRGLGVRRRARARTGTRRGAAGHPAGTDGLGPLSEAERGIAELVCQGLTNRQIADLTFVSPNTVAFHLRNIYRKLGLASRVQLTRLVLDTQHSRAPQQPG
jgi:DNA-binding CsgD family transcriptional regulator/tetratricopeptide (TPR) repeat protein